MSARVAAELKALMLWTPRLTLAAAESMTCGHVQAVVGAVSGASEFFRGGITAYALDEKVRHLGVDRAAAKAANCVSAGIAEQMARGACHLFGADVGVATTGYAEPFGVAHGGPAKAAGIAEPFAWWALAHRVGRKFIVRSGRVECVAARRTEAQAIVAQAVLTELVAYLRGWRETD